jgi:hypothetical protein
MIVSKAAWLIIQRGLAPTAIIASTYLFLVKKMAQVFFKH